jgi:hypothetical protein
VTGTVNVLEAARKARVGKVVYAESSALYEGSRVFPTPETDVHPESFYATSKLASRHFAEAYARFYGLNLTALRYFCVYGPAQDYRRTIPPVMSAFIIRLLQGRPPVVHGTGRKRRDFVFVDDINDFHLRCLDDPRTNGRTFNLGSGVSYSVLEILGAVSDLLEIRIDPVSADLPEKRIRPARFRAARSQLGAQDGPSPAPGHRLHPRRIRGRADRIMKAFLLAAGKGTRLKPLTDRIPKVMIPVAGRPILEHHVRLLAAAGIREIYVNLHHLPQKIKGYFEDGRKWAHHLFP